MRVTARHHSGHQQRCDFGCVVVEARTAAKAGSRNLSNRNGRDGEIRTRDLKHPITRALVKCNELILHRDAAMSKIKVFYICYHLLPFTYSGFQFFPATAEWGEI